MSSMRYGLRLLFIGSLVAVSLLSLLPPGSEPSISFLSDKLQHVSAYAWTALIGAMAYSSKRGKITILVALPMFGGAIELAQYFVPGRTPELADEIANLIGTVVGLLLALIVARFRPTRRETLG
jgi:VanZ family protein